MSKLRDQQVHDFRYGRPQEVQKVLEFCAENPTWPKLTDKKTDEQMILAAGLRTRRFVFDKGDEKDPDTVKDIFRFVWMPLARYEPLYLEANVVPEFESPPFRRNPEIGDDVNRVLHLVKNPPSKSGAAGRGGSASSRGGRGRPGTGPGGLQPGPYNGGGDEYYNSDDPGYYDEGSGGGYPQEGFYDPRGFNPEDEEQYYDQGYGNGYQDQGYGNRYQDEEAWQEPEQWEPGPHEDQGHLVPEDVDPYNHEHEICRCKKCANLRGPLRCKICGDTLTAADIRKVEENEAKREAQNKRVEEQRKITQEQKKKDAQRREKLQQEKFEAEQNRKYADEVKRQKAEEKKRVDEERRQKLQQQKWEEEERRKKAEEEYRKQAEEKKKREEEERQQKLLEEEEKRIRKEKAKAKKEEEKANKPPAIRVQSAHWKAGYR